MGIFDKTLGSANLDSLHHSDALQQKSERIPSNSAKGQAKGKNKLALRATDSIHNSSKSFKSAMPTKRALQADPEAPEAVSKKRAAQKSSQDLVVREAMARIIASDKCRAALESAKANNIPEVFIDSKDKGLRFANIGKDLIFLYECDQSLISTGQISQGPTAWGRAFVFLPGTQKLEVLDDFNKIKDHEHALSLLSGVAEISDIKDKPFAPHTCPYSAAARLDLMLRFGLLGCETNIALATEAKDLVPASEQSDAYSFALQNAVEYGDMNMISYCLDNKARPISRDEGRYDYREDSPIEIAFSTGTLEIQNTLMKHLDRVRDIEEIKRLFLNEDRWEAPPKAIVDFIGKS